MVALEMAAPDHDEAYDPPRTRCLRSRARRVDVGRPHHRRRERSEPMAAPAVQPLPEPSVAAALEPLSRLLLVRARSERNRAKAAHIRARSAGPDPPRVVSQTEKIAFSPRARYVPQDRRRIAPEQPGSPSPDREMQHGDTAGSVVGGDVARNRLTFLGGQARSSLPPHSRNRLRRCGIWRLAGTQGLHVE